MIQIISGTCFADGSFLIYEITLEDAEHSINIVAKLNVSMRLCMKLVFSNDGHIVS